MRILLVSVATLLIGAAPMGQQFDLICGKDRLRVDLRAGEWCGGNCTTITKIVSNTASTIVFMDDPRARGSMAMYSDVNRLTGRSTTRMYSGQDVMSEYASQCDRAPFSGFPTARAKF